MEPGSPPAPATTATKGGLSRRLAAIGLLLSVAPSTALVLALPLGEPWALVFLIASLFGIAALILALVGMRGAGKQLRLWLALAALASVAAALFDLWLCFVIVMFPKC